jgi:hypothetical protein
MSLPNPAFGSGTGYTPDPSLLLSYAGAADNVRIGNSMPGLTPGVSVNTPRGGSLSQPLPLNGMLVAQSLPFPMPSAEWLLQQLVGGGEQAFNNAMSVLKTVAEWSKPLAQELVKKVVELAGGVEGLAKKLAPLGARVLSPLITFIKGISLSSLAVALVGALVLLGLTPEGLADGTLPEHLRQPTPPQTPAQTTPQPTTTGNVPTTQPQKVPLAQTPIGQSQISLFNNGTANITTANDWMARTSDNLMPLNNAMQQFYWNAAGGTAARSAGALSEPIAQVQRLRNDLAYINSQSNAPIASILSTVRSLEQIANNPANAGQLFSDLRTAIDQFKAHGANLNELRDAYKALVQSLDVWLVQAHKHASDGTQPLPALPPTIFTPSNVSADRVLDDLQRAHSAAQGVLDASARARTQTVEQPPQALPSPSQVLPAQSGWINPATGAVSDQRASAQDVRVSVQWVNAFPPGVQPMRIEVDGEGLEAHVVRNENGDLGFMVRNPNPNPNNGNRGPDWKKLVLSALVASGPVGAVFLGQSIEGRHRAGESERVNAITPNFASADASANAILGSLGPTSTEGQIREARTQIWQAYFNAANSTLDQQKWNNFTLIPGGKMFSPEDMGRIREDQSRFLIDLGNRELPTRPGGVLGNYTTRPILEGDPLKAQHLSRAMDLTNARAQERINEIAQRTQGLGAAAKFNVEQRIYQPGTQQLRPEFTSGARASIDEARRTTYVAILDHYLQQVPSGLGAQRVTAEELAVYRSEVKEWLSRTARDYGQSALDTTTFNPSLARNRPDVQQQLAYVMKDAVAAINKFEALVPRPPLEERVRPTPTAPTGAIPMTPTPATNPVTPRPTTPQPVTPQTAAETTPSPTVDAQRQATVAQLLQLIAQAQPPLTNPPRAETVLRVGNVDEKTVHFKPEMFFTPGEPRTSAAIQAASNRALALYNQILSVGEQSPPTVKELVFRPLLVAFQRDVFDALNAMVPVEPTPVTPTPTTPPVTPVPTPQ